MTDLRKPCEHGRYEEHGYWVKVAYMDYRDVAPCPGGQPPTLDDLKAEVIRLEPPRKPRYKPTAYPQEIPTDHVAEL